MILLVDDDPTTLRLLEMTLRREHLQTISTRSAEDALELLRREECSLIITDFQMPGMSGLEFLGRLRAEPATAGIPVVMCTVSADSDTVHEAIRQGVRDFIVKPIVRQTVAAKIRAILARPEPILEPRYATTVRLGLSDAEYGILARITLDHMDVLIGDLARARSSENLREAVRLAARAREPAELLGAERVTLAVRALQQADNDPARERCVNMLAEELVGFRGALDRAIRTLAVA
jgi:CheY-like chemotaxis protein